MLRFVLFSGILSLFLWMAVLWGSGQGWFVPPSYSDEIVLFLGISHIGLYGLIVRQLGKRPEDFVMVYLGSTVLRILFFGLFIFRVIRLDSPAAQGNALFFLVSYFLFTALEVVMLYIVVRKQQPPSAGQKEG